MTFMKYNNTTLGWKF